MIGQFPNPNKGAVPAAKLYASGWSIDINPDPAVIMRLKNAGKQEYLAALIEEEGHARALSFKTITKANDGDMPIVNISATGARVTNPLDGSHYWNMMLDYFAAAEDTLFFAGNSNTDKNSPVYASSYNGLIISSLEQLGLRGYVGVVLGRASPVPDRTRSRVQLVAPGEDIPVATCTARVA